MRPHSAQHIMPRGEKHNNKKRLPSLCSATSKSKPATISTARHANPNYNAFWWFLHGSGAGGLFVQLLSCGLKPCTYSHLDLVDHGQLRLDLVVRCSLLFRGRSFFGVSYRCWPRLRGRRFLLSLGQPAAKKRARVKKMFRAESGETRRKKIKTRAEIVVYIMRLVHVRIVRHVSCWAVRYEKRK